MPKTPNLAQITARLWVAEQHTTVVGTVNGEPNKVTRVVMRAATRGDENKAWAAATPSASFELTVNNPDALAWFEQMIGRDVAVTITARDDTPHPSPYGP